MHDEEQQGIEHIAASAKPVISTQQELSLKNVGDAEKILEIRTPVDTVSLLADTDVLMYGDIHTDYAIPDYLLAQVVAFKTAGVTSFGFEINQNPRLQKIFDEINAGNIDRASEVDWSFGFGNPTVRQTKQQLVTELVKAGIRVYPFASWGKDMETEGKPYAKESEEEAAEIISQQTTDGKTVVLVGGQHAEYNDNRKVWRFPHTADCVKSLGKRVKSIAIAGGMNNPMGYSRDPKELIRRAARKSNSGPATIIDTTQQKIEGFHNDGILVLPEVPFLAANQPIPPERMPVGKFTPLDNVRPAGAEQAVRAVISSAK